MSQLPLRKKLIFFSPLKCPLHLLRKHIRSVRLCTCNIFGSRAAVGGGVGEEKKKKRTHSLSNFMLCSPAKVKVWQKWTQSLPLATVAFHLSTDGSAWLHHCYLIQPLWGEGDTKRSALTKRAVKEEKNSQLKIIRISAETDSAGERVHAAYPFPSGVYGLFDTGWQSAATLRHI